MLDPKDHIVAGNTYRVSQMDAMRQFYVAKRLTPVLGPIMEAAVSLGANRDPAAMMKVAMPAMEAVGRLPDADAEFIISTCLSFVQRQEASGWSAVWNQGAKRAQFADINLPAMLQLVGLVVMEQLGGFFPTGLPNTIAPPQPAPASMP